MREYKVLRNKEIKKRDYSISKETAADVEKWKKKNQIKKFEIHMYAIL